MGEMGTTAVAAPAPTASTADTGRAGHFAWLADLSTPRVALLIWLVTRAAFAILTVDAAVVRLSGREAVPSPNGPLLRYWWFWDGSFLVHLATHGYESLAYAAYFPLYPLLIAAATRVFGPGAGLAAALAISNVAAFFALWGVGALARTLDARFARASHLAMWLLACSPLAFFLAAAYSDGVFLAAAVWALVCARRRAWGPAAGLAFVAGLARPTALALPPALAWEYAVWLRGIAGPRPRDWWPAITGGGWRAHIAAVVRPLALVGAVPAAWAAYGAFCALRFGDPLAFLHVQTTIYGHTPLWPWESLWRALGQWWGAPAWSATGARILVDLAPVLVAGGTLAAGWRRLPGGLALYGIGLWLLCVCTPATGQQFPDLYVSVGRYLLADVPAFVLLAVWLRRAARARWALPLLLGASFALQLALLTADFTNGWIV